MILKEKRSSSSRTTSQDFDTDKNSMNINGDRHFGDISHSKSSLVSGNRNTLDSNRSRETDSIERQEEKEVDTTTLVSLPQPESMMLLKKKEFDAVDFDFSDFDLSEHKQLFKKKSVKSLLLSSPVRFQTDTDILNKAERTPVIIVTDIGADIDDTLALFVMIGGIDAIRVVAVVTSVNNGLHRGAVTRGFLRLLGIEDSNVEILPSVDGCVAECYIPEGFPVANQAAMCSISETPRKLLDICKEYEHSGLILYGIASLTPVAEAIRLDKDKIIQRAIKKVYLQGNIDLTYTTEGVSVSTNDPEVCKSSSVRLQPNPDAYNFKNDMAAAREVFNYLQDSAPFTLLGKYAAYRVPITKGDFSKWTHQIATAYNDTIKNRIKDIVIPTPPDLLNTAKRQMKAFRAGNPKKFDQIYEIPVGLTPEQMEKFEWFDQLCSSEYVCSHPYDPLLGLKLLNDVRADKAKSSNLSQSHVLHSQQSLFEEYHCFNENGIRHTILGNIPERHSIPNPDLVRDVLVKQISSGLRFQVEYSKQFQ